MWSRRRTSTKVSILFKGVPKCFLFSDRQFWLELFSEQEIIKWYRRYKLNDNNSWAIEHFKPLIVKLGKNCFTFYFHSNLNSMCFNINKMAQPFRIMNPLRALCVFEKLSNVHEHLLRIYFCWITNRTLTHDKQT